MNPVISYWYDGSVYTKKYYDPNKRLHRCGGPSVIQYYYHRMGVTNRPAVFIKQYHRHGKLHKLKGPAEIWYRSDGNVHVEKFYKNGQLYEIVNYAGAGIVASRQFYKSKLLHKIDGPVVIVYKNGKIVGREYYIKGIKIK